VAVHDLWFKVDSITGAKIASARHGRGKRWRVRGLDPATGKTRDWSFARERDAKAYDAKLRSGVAEPTGQIGGRPLTFGEYAERWRESRKLTHAEGTRASVESVIRLHLVPSLGHLPIRALTTTHVLEWVTAKVTAGAARNSVKTYFDTLRMILRSAAADGIIAAVPTNGINLRLILRDLERPERFTPTTEQVLALLDVVDDRYRALIWLGAAQGLRLGEALGVEATPSCVDFLRRKLHVVQQLQRSPVYGGYYLCQPKADSSGTLDLDPQVALVLAEHLREHPAVTLDLPDICTGEPAPGQAPKRRAVTLAFTSMQGRPVAEATFGRAWAAWRTRAGLPEAFTFHGLRRYYGVQLIAAGAAPQAVQQAMRHRNLQTTLTSYAGHWPDGIESLGGVVGSVLTNAARSPRLRVVGQDRS
jgi:integrase